MKHRDIPRKPSKKEIERWLPFLLEEIKTIRPKGIIVLGKRTYMASFRPHVEQAVPKSILIDWVYHYSTQVPRWKFERRFSETLERMKQPAKAADGR